MPYVLLLRSLAHRGQAQALASDFPDALTQAAQVGRSLGAFLVEWSPLEAMQGEADTGTATPADVAWEADV